LRIYVAQVVLTNAHLGIGDPFQFLQEAKNVNFGQIFNKIQKWWLTVPQLGGIWKIKNTNVKR